MKVGSGGGLGGSSLGGGGIGVSGNGGGGIALSRIKMLGTVIFNFSFYLHFSFLYFD